MFEDDSLEEKIDIGNKSFVEYSIDNFLKQSNISEDTLKTTIKNNQTQFTIYNATKSGLSYEALECLSLLIECARKIIFIFLWKNLQMAKKLLKLK